MLYSHKPLPWWLSGKDSACSAGILGSIPELGRSPGGGHGGEFHGQGSLAGYSPWGRKESDTTEWLTHTHTVIEEGYSLEGKKVERGHRRIPGDLVILWKLGAAKKKKKSNNQGKENRANRATFVRVCVCVWAGAGGWLRMPESVWRTDQNRVCDEWGSCRGGLVLHALLERLDFVWKATEGFIYVCGI